MRQKILDIILVIVIVFVAVVLVLDALIQSGVW